MACGCENTTCIEVKFNPCSIGAELPLVASETGDITGEIEFNGVWTTFSVGVLEGENIVILTSLLNEYYTHLLKMYNEAGALINNTCYTVKSRAMLNAPDFSVLPPGEVVEVFNITVEEEGIALSDPLLANSTVMLLNTDAQSYNSVFFTKDFASDTLTGLGISFYIGQIVTVTLKRS